MGGFNRDVSGFVGTAFLGFECLGALCGFSRALGGLGGYTKVD